MLFHWLVITAFVAQATLPLGGNACDCVRMQSVEGPECYCECPSPAECECGCKDVRRQPANHADATSTQSQQAPSPAVVPHASLPLPAAVSSNFVSLDVVPRASDTTLCLTRAERAPPA